jgi:hypothetical protein
MGDSGQGGRRATHNSLLLLYFFTTAVKLAVADFRCNEDIRKEQDLEEQQTASVTKFVFHSMLRSTTS